MKKSLKKVKGKMSKKEGKENLQKIGMEETKDVTGGKDNGDPRHPKNR